MTPDAFISRWRQPLEARAQIVFRASERGYGGGNYCAVANAFVEQHGFKPIGFNWELLDPEASPDKPRSARGVIAEAFARDMALPQTQWLGETAKDCAADFVALFDQSERTIVSNRMGDLWNPLTDARIEWGFVGFDAERIALLLAMTND